MGLTMTDVVAALIWDGCKFLACQRPEHKKRGLLWEFVGGKTEPGESLEEALIRECKEELDITVKPEHIFMQVIHPYPDMTVRLTLYNAVITEGKPKLLEHNAIQWMTTDHIDPNIFCPADKDILAELSIIHNHLQAELYALRETNYRKFMLSLIPGYSAEHMMGVRMPAIRKLAKSIKDPQEIGMLPYQYYEEYCIHGLLINQERNYHRALDMLDAFLPHVDNWAVCDLLSPISFRSCPASLLDHVKEWLKSNHPYTIRFAIGVLRKFYLGKTFSTDQMEWIAKVQTNHYYVNMMIAWYFATALDKQTSAALSFLSEGRLDPWTHNKTIQKACESFCIPNDIKSTLRTMKVKGDRL